MALLVAAVALCLVVSGTAAWAGNYAVLINGGWNVDNGSPTYWNDISATYQTLKNTYGYTDESIFVLNSDGADSGDDMKVLTKSIPSGAYDGYYYASSPLDLDSDGTDDVDYAATRANVSTVFDTLAGVMTSDDMLFLMSTDHGMTGSGALCLWGETITDSEFAAEVDKIEDYALQSFVFQQCFSGVFIDDLAGEKRVVVSSAAGDESSWGWIAGDPGLDGYAEFLHQYIEAMEGAGDVNGDGYVTYREAYDYALFNDYFGPYGPSGDMYLEHPQYSNFGDIGTEWTLAGALPLNVVPEPISLIFFGTGVVGVAGFVMRKRMRKSA